MQRKISGFRQDEHGDRVAQLECGHGQHVRHRPLWTNRPWVTTDAGRARYPGRTPRCKQCEQGTASKPGQDV